jgi:hypothetical protein
MNVGSQSDVKALAAGPLGPGSPDIMTDSPQSTTSSCFAPPCELEADDRTGIECSGQSLQSPRTRRVLATFDPRDRPSRSHSPRQLGLGHPEGGAAHDDDSRECLEGREPLVLGAEFGILEIIDEVIVDRRADRTDAALSRAVRFSKSANLSRRVMARRTSSRSA